MKNINEVNKNFDIDIDKIIKKFVEEKNILDEALINKQKEIDVISDYIKALKEYDKD